MDESAKNPTDSPGATGPAADSVKAATKSITERLAAAAAATSGANAATTVTGKAQPAQTTGVANAKTLQAVNAAAIAQAKKDAITKPVKTSPDQVLFRSARPHLRSANEKGIRFGFENGYFLTDDATTIAFIRANAEHWQVTEEK